MTFSPDVDVSDAIYQFQAESQELALVIEDGNVVEMVTVTDLLESIMGDREDPVDVAPEQFRYFCCPLIPIGRDEIPDPVGQNAFLDSGEGMSMTASGEASDYDGLQDFLRESVVTGTAIILPLLVTVLVLRFFVNFVSQILEPVVQLVSVATGTGGLPDPVLKLITFLTLVTAILFVGVISESGSVHVGGGATLETLIARIPGIGSLYQGVDEMSQVLLDNDTDSFQEVKLVEFPTDGSFSLAFLTAETPEVVMDPLEHEEMVTVYLPLAPNPVVGGYVLHVAAERVYDVDMTVEEGIQSIVTSGVATGHHSGDTLSEDMIDRINRRFKRMDIVPRVESFEEYAQVAYEKLGPAHSESTDSSETSEESGDSNPGDR